MDSVNYKQHLRVLNLPVQSVTDRSKRHWKDSCIWLHRRCSLLAQIRWRNTISIFLYTEFLLLHFFCPRIPVKIVYKPPPHPSPEVADSPGSCICPMFFRCRGLKIDKISDWLYFIHPCCIWDTLHSSLWLPANKEVKKFGERNQFAAQY